MGESLKHQEESPHGLAMDKGTSHCNKNLLNWLVCLMFNDLEIFRYKTGNNNGCWENQINGIRKYIQRQYVEQEYY